MPDPLISDQTVAGLVAQPSDVYDLTSTPPERAVLRALAGAVGELAALPIEAEKARLWTRHNDLHPERPMVFIDPENGWNEIITQDQLQCRAPLLRAWEMALRKEIHWATVLRDDRVIEPFFNVPYVFRDTVWGLTETQIPHNVAAVLTPGTIRSRTMTATGPGCTTPRSSSTGSRRMRCSPLPMICSATCSRCASATRGGGRWA